MAQKMAHRTYQERGYCTRAGYDRLDEVLGQLCDLGNAALQERRDAWRIARKRISYQDQCRSLTLVRQDEPDELGRLNVAAARGALQRVDRAFKAFFRRCKEGGKPGYPRFRSRKRYVCLETNDPSASQIQQDRSKVRIRINGLPTVTLKPHRELPAGRPRTIRITRRPTGCTVDLVYEHAPVALEPTGAAVGIDFGVRKRLTLSTGDTFAPEHDDQKAIRRMQRAVARCRRRSKTRLKRVRRLAKLRRRTAVQRRNSAHCATTMLVHRFDTIAVEQLQIANMTRSARGDVETPGHNVRAKSGLNRSILEQTWGQIRTQLAYKAEWAGRRLVAIDPRYTSQNCSGCGGRRSRPDGRERWRCEHCGAEHDRDVNAALNILRAGILALASESSGRTDA